MHIVAALTARGRTGHSERWEDLAAGRFLRRTSLAPDETADGFDGVSSWTSGRSGIAYRLGDVDARLVAADESYRTARAWWFRDRHAASAESAGTRDEGGRQFDILTITPEGGRPFAVWIDRSSHLLDRTVEQQAEDLVVVRYSDYRRVGGIMLPFTIRTGDGADPAFDAVETVEHVDIDPAVPDTIYDLPPRPKSDIAFPGNADSVTVPFRLENDIIVPLSVDGGPPVDAEFDSGGNLIIQPALVAELGLTVSGRGKETGGGEGFTTTATGTAHTLSLGGAIIRNPVFQSFAFRESTPKEALIGLETLQRFVVAFDFDRMVMTLSRPDTFSYRGSGTVIPFHFQDNQPEITGAVDGIAGLFTVDTGDAGSLLLIAPFARRYGLAERYHAILSYGGQAIGKTRGVWARPGEVTLDGPDGRPAERVTGPVARISQQESGFDANRNVSGNIGLGILKQFNLTFDYPRQQIILERNHFYGAPDIFNRAGFRVKPQDDAWVVTIVYPNSPAAEAGMKTGDIVDRIDGRGPAQLSPSDLTAALAGPVGSRLAVSLRSGGSPKTVQLTLRNLL